RNVRGHGVLRWGGARSLPTAQRTKQIDRGVSAAVRVRLGDDLAGGEIRAPVAGGVRAVGLIAEPAAVDLVVARRAPHGGRRFSVHGRARLRRPSAGAVRPASRPTW